MLKIQNVCQSLPFHIYIPHRTEIPRHAILSANFLNTYVISKADYTQRCQGANFCGRLFIFKPCAHKRSVPYFLKCDFFFFFFTPLHLKSCRQSHAKSRLAEIAAVARALNSKCPSVSSKRFPVLQNHVLPFNENIVFCCSTHKVLIWGFCSC